MIQSYSKRMRALTLLFALSFIASAVPFSYAEENPTKEEVVYATLSNGGTLSQATVVNIFNLSAEQDLFDFGAYASVENLTNTNPISSDGEMTRVHADKGRFYYQGALENAALPWEFSVIYSLDYVPIEPENLAGKSGRLGMRLVSTKNPLVNTVFYDNYMLQISVTLDAAKCIHIEADGATVVNAGGSKQLSFTILPGKDADCSLSADVVDFEMDGISVNAVPMSISIERPDTESISSDIRELQDAITELDDGIAELRSGVRELREGAKELADGSHKFSDGLTALPGANKQLSGYSAQFNLYLKQMKQTAGTQPSTAGTRMQGELARMGAALGALEMTYPSDPNVAALKASFGEMGSYCRTLIVLCNYISGQYDSATGETSPGLADNYDSFNRQLNSYLNGLDAIKENYGEIDGGIQELRDALIRLSGGVGELKDGTGELHDETSDMDTVIEDKIDELMADYDKGDFVPVSFVSERNTNVQSVQFVIKTKGIAEKEVEAPEPVPESEPTFLQRLGALFGFGA